MAGNAAFASVLIAGFAGSVLSVAIERRMTPLPQRGRPSAAWVLHMALWLVCYGFLVLLLGRPWFAMAGVSAILLTLVLVNNAKVKALQEPFVFQDYEYFIDSVRHPRLFIPFLGWGRFLAAAAGFASAVFIGFWSETVPAQRFSWFGQLGAVAVVTGIGILLVAGSRKSLFMDFEPARDIPAFGLLPCLFRYGEEERTFPTAKSPFNIPSPTDRAGDLPHLVAVQSESFFDPRSLYAGIRTDVLAAFDRLKEDGIAHGKLSVPAWGANTVRTEFAFLSGVDEAALGVHRFNPYRAVAAGWDVQSLASFLKRLGYRTICIHPYPASFYRRDRVYPRLGFDAFLDIRVFAETDKSGPYTGDLAVAQKIAAILEAATGPLFVFAITMENHGPLHLDRVDALDIDKFYAKPPPANCRDLTIYLRHLCNADRMVSVLKDTLERCERSAAMCWFGDHVPIMPNVYETFGTPKGDVDYVYWANWKTGGPEKRDLHAHGLAMDWLQAVNVVPGSPRFDR